MKKTKEIEGINFQRLGNVTHLAYQERVYERVAEIADLSIIHLTAEDLQDWKACLDDESRGIARSRARLKTKQRKERGKSRNKRISFLFGSIAMAYEGALTAAKKEAGRRLFFAIAPFRGATSGGLDTRTGIVCRLLATLRNEKNMADIRTLGLEDALDVLEVENEEFAQLTEARTDDKAHDTQSPSATRARVRADEHFDFVVKSINGSALFCTDEEEQKVIDGLIGIINVITGETKEQVARSSGDF